MAVFFISEGPQEGVRESHLLFPSTLLVPTDCLILLVWEKLQFPAKFCDKASILQANGAHLGLPGPLTGEQGVRCNSFHLQKRKQRFMIPWRYICWLLKAGIYTVCCMSTHALSTLLRCCPDYTFMLTSVYISDLWTTQACDFKACA